MLHAKFLRDLLKLEVVKKSATKLFFISEADSPLRFIEDRSFKEHMMKSLRIHGAIILHK